MVKSSMLYRDKAKKTNCLREKDKCDWLQWWKERERPYKKPIKKGKGEKRVVS